MNILIDLKLRNLTDAMYLCTCHFGWLSVARKIKRSITLVHPQGDAESRIADDLDFEPLWWSLFGAKTCVLTFIPNWVQFFDSHEKLGLPMITNATFTDIPLRLKKTFKDIKFKNIEQLEELNSSVQEDELEFFNI